MQGTEWKHKCIERKNMEKINRGNIKWRRKKKDGVDWLIGDQEDFKAKNITKIQSLFLDKRSVYEEDVTIQIFMYLEIEIYETKVERTARKYR